MERRPPRPRSRPPLWGSSLRASGRRPSRSSIARSSGNGMVAREGGAAGSGPPSRRAGAPPPGNTPPPRRRQDRCSQQPCAARAERGVHASTTTISTVGEGEPAVRVKRLGSPNAEKPRRSKIRAWPRPYPPLRSPAFVQARVRAGPKVAAVCCQALAACGWIRFGSLPREEADVVRAEPTCARSGDDPASGLDLRFDDQPTSHPFFCSIRRRPLAPL